MQNQAGGGVASAESIRGGGGKHGSEPTNGSSGSSLVSSRKGVFRDEDHLLQNSEFVTRWLHSTGGIGGPQNADLSCCMLHSMVLSSCRLLLLCADH